MPLRFCSSPSTSVCCLTLSLARLPCLAHSVETLEDSQNVLSSIPLSPQSARLSISRCRRTQERLDEQLSGAFAVLELSQLLIGPLHPLAGPAAKPPIPQTIGRTNGSQIWLCGPLRRLPGRCS